jgi:hypothetical protein
MSQTIAQTSVNTGNPVFAIGSANLSTLPELKVSNLEPVESVQITMKPLTHNIKIVFESADSSEKNLTSWGEEKKLSQNSFKREFHAKYAVQRYS